MSSLLLFLLLLQEPLAPKNHPAKQSLEVPFGILASRHMVVDVRVNGEGPYRLIFDTGAPFNLVSTKLAKAAKLSAVDATKGNARGPMGMMAFGGMIKAKKVEIGEVEMKDMPVMVMDHPTVKALATFVGDLDGIVGFPFFARYRTTIDYEARKMTLEPVDYVPEDVLAGMLKVLTQPKNKPMTKRLGAPTLFGFEVKKEEGDEADGIPVVKVWEGSAAADAGLKVGDRLMVLDGTWTNSAEDCFRAAAGVKPGQSVQMKIVREKSEMPLSIKPKNGV